MASIQEHTKDNQFQIQTKSVFMSQFVWNSENSKLLAILKLKNLFQNDGFKKTVPSQEKKNYELRKIMTVIIIIIIIIIMIITEHHREARF